MRTGYICLYFTVVSTTEIRRKYEMMWSLQIGPSASSRGLWSMMCRNMGNRKAMVFPLPVFAMPIRSRPDMTAGMACAWMGVGLS